MHTTTGNPLIIRKLAHMDEITPDDAGLMLKHYMEFYRLTGEEMALQMGKTPQTIYNWRSTGVPAGQVRFLQLHIASQIPGSNILELELDQELIFELQKAAEASGLYLQDYINQIAENAA